MRDRDFKTKRQCKIWKSHLCDIMIGKAYHSVPSTSKTIPLSGGAPAGLLFWGSRGANLFGVVLTRLIARILTESCGIARETLRERSLEDPPISIWRGS